MARLSRREQEVETVLSKLAEITFSPEGGPKDSYALHAAAAFGRPKFRAGDYTVGLGLTHAALALEHPTGYKTSEWYEARLKGKQWLEKAKKVRGTWSKRTLRAIVGWRSDIAAASAGVDLGALTRSTTEVQWQAEYPVVRKEADRWVIGTHMGDPRQPGGEELGHCLSGLYLDGDRESVTRGIEIKTEGKSRKPLCLLTQVERSNDSRVKLAIVVPVGALLFDIERITKSIWDKGLRFFDRKRAEDEFKLRELIVKVCLRKASTRRVTDEHLLPGEFVISIAEQAIELADKSEQKPGGE